jgi:uncharacterized protein (DUF1501 family)
VSVNPDRSHFASMAIWQTARVNRSEHSGLGWLGRGLDVDSATAGQSGAIHIGSGAPPVARRGRRSATSSFERLDDLRLDPGVTNDGKLRASQADGGDLAAFVRRSALDAYTTADRMAELARSGKQDSPYPDTALAHKLSLIAQLLKGGFAARVFYTAQSGYDTHAAQATSHASLLSELSGGLLAFLDDLARAKLADRVTVLCFSEFGRRVAENGSADTDHGTAAPVFLTGRASRVDSSGRRPVCATWRTAISRWRSTFAGSMRRFSRAGSAFPRRPRWAARLSRCRCSGPRKGRPGTRAVAFSSGTRSSNEW